MKGVGPVLRSLPPLCVRLPKGDCVLKIDKQSVTAAQDYARAW